MTTAHGAAGGLADAPLRSSAEADVDVLDWPAFPPIVQDLLDALEAEELEEPEDESEEDADQPPALRPWDLANLPSPARESVVGWLHQVARWLNHSYAWRPEQIIPACWRQHPHIAHELAVIAFHRHLGYQTAATTHPVRWHDDLAGFYARMQTALGEGGRECRKGKHEPRETTTELEAFDRATT